MKVIINYWRNPSGKAPVEKYIDDIDNREERAELLVTLNGIQRHGTDAVGVEFRQIEGKLWEPQDQDAWQPAQNILRGSDRQ